MTLHDAGLWFRLFGAFVGVCLVARVILPFIIEGKQQREADARRASEVQHYLDESVRKYY